MPLMDWIFIACSLSRGNARYYAFAIKLAASAASCFSFAAACFTRVIAARARDAREMYSVAIVLLFFL